MRVSLSGDDAEAAAALVNAVVHAYLEEVAGTEMEKRTKQLDRLDRLLAEKEEELRSSRNLRNQLAEHVGTVETPAGSVGQQLALEEVLDARKDLSAARNDLRRAQAERRADDALLSNPTAPRCPTTRSTPWRRTTPQIVQVLMPLVAELKKKMLGDSPAVAEQAAGKLKAVEAEISHAARRASWRGQEARKRAAIEGDIGRLRSQIFAPSNSRPTARRRSTGWGKSRPRPPNQHRVGGGAGQGRAAGGSGTAPWPASGNACKIELNARAASHLAASRRNPGEEGRRSPLPVMDPR